MIISSQILTYFSPHSYNNPLNSYRLSVASEMGLVLSLQSQEAEQNRLHSKITSTRVCPKWLLSSQYKVKAVTVVWDHI